MKVNIATVTENKIIGSIVICLMAYFAFFVQKLLIEYNTFLYYFYDLVLYCLLVVPILVIYSPYKQSIHVKIQAVKLIILVFIISLCIVSKTIIRYLIVKRDLINMMDVDFYMLRFTTFIVGAIFEETTCRYLLQGGLKEKDFSRVICIGISSIVFAILHMYILDVNVLFRYIFHGVILGIVYELSNNNLFVVTAFHLANNLIILF